jgi:glutathione S-transferase
VLARSTCTSGCDDNDTAILLDAAPFLLFAQHLGASFDGYPKIQKYLQEVKARTAVVQVLKLHEQADTMGQRDYFSGLI